MNPSRPAAADRPMLGISSCLLGENVRYDGTARCDEWIAGTLSRHVRLVPLCPEVAVGMGVPRPPIRLVSYAGGVRAEGVTEAGLDVTDALRAYGARMAAEVTDISGYIFKARSPSCGVVGVALYAPGSDAPHMTGTGLYTAEWQARRPELPIEEEGGLGDPNRRDSFLERVFALHRWRRATSRGSTADRIRQFHATHRLNLMSRGAGVLQGMDARVKRRDSGGAGYLPAFMAALQSPATRAGHGRVLEYVSRRLRGAWSRADREEFSAALRAYRSGRIPFAVPATLLNHHLCRAGIDTFAESAYLNPSPGEWLVRAG